MALLQAVESCKRPEELARILEIRDAEPIEIRVAMGTDRVDSEFRQVFSAHFSRLTRPQTSCRDILLPWPQTGLPHSFPKTQVSRSQELCVS